MKNLLLIATIVCIASVVYFGMNTFPDIKIFTLLGFQFGINYNEFMFLKMITLCLGVGYLIFRFKENGDKQS